MKRGLIASIAALALFLTAAPAFPKIAAKDLKPQVVAPALITSIGFFKPKAVATPFDLSFVTNAQNTSTLSTFTFTSQSLGAADASRIIIVGIGGNGGGSAKTINSVTVGGISGTVVVTRNNADTVCALWQVAVPTGTTGNVVVTFSGSMARIGIALYRLVGATAAATATANNISGNPSTTINIVAGGGAVAMSFTQANESATWSGLTEGSDVTFVSNCVTSASQMFATTQTGRTVTCTYSGSTANSSMVVAAWGPA